MALFTDTVTLFQKRSGTWHRTVVKGVQWSDRIEKTVQAGQMQAAKSTTITFPEATLSQIDLSSFTEEDAVFYGEITAIIDDSDKTKRISTLISNHPKSGIIRAVNDNSNRDFLKNIKVVIY